MSRFVIALCWSLCLCSISYAQAVRFEFRDTLLISGTPAVLPLKAYNFESVVSFQFSIGWDSTLTLSEAQFDPVLESGLVFNTFPDHLNVSWLGPSSGISLPDETALLSLAFETKGCPGDTARVGLTEAYIPWEVGQVEDGGLSLTAPDTASNQTTWRAPNLLQPEDTLICQGNSLSLSVDCMDCISVEWENAPAGPTISIDSGGVYPVAATSVNDCFFSDTVSVQLDTFQLDTLEDTQRCPDDTISLVLPDIFMAYEWSNGAGGSSIVVNDEGLYTVTVTNNNGCLASDSARIEDLSLPVGMPFAEPPVLCPGDSSLLMLDTLAVASTAWFDQNGLLIAEDSLMLWIVPDTTLSYTTVSSNACGTDTAEVLIELIEFEASAGQGTCIAEGTSVELQASGGKRYQWLEGEYPVPNPDIANPVVQPADSTWFTVAITGPSDCVIIDSVFIEVATNPLASIMPINLITPNADGRNDVLFFKNLAKFPGNQLTVWNRWGQVVYQKSEYQQDEERWGGTSNGRPLPDGEYYYLLEVNGAQIQQTLSIIRE